MRRLLRRLPASWKARIWRLLNLLGPRVWRIRAGPAAGWVIVAPWRRRLGYVLGAHEPHVTAAIEGLLEPGMTAIDAGAHLGFFTLQMAKRVGPTGRVIAFEPYPPHGERLAETLRRNGLPQVELVAAALGESPGEDPLEVTPNRSMVRVGEPPSGGPQPGPWVPRSSLDGWAAEAGLERLDLLKLDVEGHELAALRGASDLLARLRPKLLLELHWSAAVACHPRQVVDLLREAGYRLARLPATEESLEDLLRRIEGRTPPRHMTAFHVLAVPQIGDGMAEDFG